MNIHQKEMLQTLQNLVISMLIILVLLSCASIRQKEKDESLKIINIEIESHKSFVLNDSVVFNYIPNEYLAESIKGHSELSNYLIDADKRYFLEILDSKEESVSNYKLPIKFSFQEDLKLDEVEKLKIKRISVSKPIFSENSDFALIAYAYGYKNSMQGGIKKYNLIEGEWKLDQSFNLWVE